jgi:hypothetical protein
MPRTIFKEGKKYTFSDYFNMPNPVEEIIAEFGYHYSIDALKFPRDQQIDRNLLKDLVDTYYLLVPKVSLNSEIAKRELMIAPLLHAVIKTLNATLNIEYSIDIDDKLAGTIDYLFRSSQELIVIEAKKGDLEKGFNQLAVEMIAMDIYEDNNQPEILYGAITIGEVWRFALLERETKQLIKDVHTFRFPEDSLDIFSILTGILNKKASEK